ncbi:MAG: hypothetical protein ACRC7O_00830, partial [Fimbriiglobus sp.]
GAGIGCGMAGAWPLVNAANMMAVGDILFRFPCVCPERRGRTVRPGRGPVLSGAFRAERKPGTPLIGK